MQCSVCSWSLSKSNQFFTPPQRHLSWEPFFKESFPRYAFNQRWNSPQLLYSVNSFFMSILLTLISRLCELTRIIERRHQGLFIVLNKSTHDNPTIFPAMKLLRTSWVFVTILNQYHWPGLFALILSLIMICLSKSVHWSPLCRNKGEEYDNKYYITMLEDVCMVHNMYQDKYVCYQASNNIIDLFQL